MLRHRRAAVAIALIKLAASDDYQDRADAGRSLASFVEATGAGEKLAQLLLDVNDTFVTLTTAEALLRRQDLAGLRIVAEALFSADCQHQTYISDAVRAVFMVFADERDRAVEVCDALFLDDNAHVREGAVVLREMLTEINPVLHPASSD